MWKQLLEFARQLVALTRKTQQHETGIKELQQELRENRQEINQLRQEFIALARVVERLSLDQQHHRESADLERRNLLLQIENTMLRFERRLPPVPSNDEEMKD